MTIYLAAVLSLLSVVSRLDTVGTAFGFPQPNGWVNETDTLGDSTTAVLMFIPQGEQRTHGSVLPPTGALLSVHDCGTGHTLEQIVSEQVGRLGPTQYDRRNYSASTKDGVRQVQEIRWQQEITKTFHYDFRTAVFTLNKHVLVVALQYRGESMKSGQYVMTFDDIIKKIVPEDRATRRENG